MPMKLSLRTCSRAVACILLQELCLADAQWTFGAPTTAQQAVYAPLPPGYAPGGPLSLVGSAPQAAPPGTAASGDGPDLCPCADGNAASGSAAESVPAAAAAGATAAVGSCQVSKVNVRQDHGGASGLSFSDVSSLYGSSALSEAQGGAVRLASVAETSFMCLDDRIAEPALGTPGGDLGEFILALAAYLQEREATNGNLTGEVVEPYLLEYLRTLPAGRPLVHCTDDRALSHLEAELPVENLDLRSPPQHAQQAILRKLMEVENQGDSHIRLMLKEPEWFQLDEHLVPAVLQAFYSLLWRQSQDRAHPLYREPRLSLHVLSGESNPAAFLEITSEGPCGDQGVAPLLTPRAGSRSVLVSHLDAVSLRRQELASFFARIANATPRKVNWKWFHERLERHGWLALETTGSRIAAGLPFFTLAYV